MKLTKLSQTALKSFVLPITPSDRQTVAVVVRGYEANERTARAHTKTRGEIRGGGRKPWRQKGTGRARVGSIRSPLWKGGGTIFGPSSTRNFKVALPQNVRRKALAIALAAKAADQAVWTVDAWPATGRTKDLRTAMNASELAPQRTLFLLAEPNESLTRAARNIPSISIRLAQQVTARDMLVARAVVADKAALKTLTARVLGEAADVRAEQVPKDES